MHQVSASNFTRSLPVHRQIEVVRALDGLNVPVVVVDKKRDHQEFWDVVDSSENCFSIKGELELREYMALVSGAKLVISPDSSAMHIATVAGTP